MALDTSKLADTQVRTSPSITIRATDTTGKLVAIGAVQSFGKNISRSNTRRMELDSNVPGMTVEMIPGAINDFTITIKRAMLNSKTMFQAFGLNEVEDLILQNIPVEIEESRHFPNSDAPQVVTYHGCYFKSVGLEVNIDRDWVLVQDASLDVAYATVKNPS